MNMVQLLKPQNWSSELIKRRVSTIALGLFHRPSMTVLCIIQGKRASFRAKTVEHSGHLPARRADEPCRYARDLNKIARAAGQRDGKGWLSLYQFQSLREENLPFAWESISGHLY
jgi:hypothetical protein